MSWLSYDDRLTEQPVWDSLPYDTRWHYLAMVERCGRSKRYDGILRWSLAQRVSDAPEPERCIKELIDAGLLRDNGAEVEILDILSFLPPEGERPENLLPRKAANQREYRKRKCERGEHDRHCPKNCPMRVTEWVAGNPGSGRVGSGGGNPYNHHREEEVPGDRR